MKEMCSAIRSAISVTLVLSLLMLHGSLSALAAGNDPKAFASPQEAITALVSAAKTKDTDAILTILGSRTKEWITSGDAVQDRLGVERFLATYDEKNGVEKQGDDKVTLVLGNDEFPFPFPVVKTDRGWAFDAEQGKEEILNRRIGRNELNTIQVLLAVVDAQLDYADVDRNGDGVLEYASRLRSSPGNKDGLYWPTGEGEPQSPLGPLVAEAAKEGYSQRKSDEGESKPQAYHGYHFKLLTRQGANAPGGEMNYVAGGSMIGGFAVLAYPARYDNSGIMSFIVSHQGIVYEADLGPGTVQEIQTIDSFDPDPGWVEVKAEYASK
jgi:Protein of unknown function (DUF2950)